MPDTGYAQPFMTAELAGVDPDVEHLIALEAHRQQREIILIPSESLTPAPVLRALGSVFNSVYAEGYPPTRMTADDEDALLEYDHQLAYYRRYGDRRFYKGTTYVHFAETLAQRRCAHLFATAAVPADKIYVNVQPLSGANANLAAYDALLQPGDTLMGMNLFQGGHLSHGSPFHISGRRYHVVSYDVDPTTERLDYDSIQELAVRERPKLIVAGYTSYPWAPDWMRFRQIADAAGARLMADIAHPAGMVTAGAYPNPVGLADVITFTTHKTLAGPRGAIILTTDPRLAQRVDSAVFPGQQGGPHANKFAAMAVAFKIATTPEFKAMQHQIVANAGALAAALQRRGLALAYGGTDTHMLLVDLRHVTGAHGYPMLAEIVVRIMELAGLVANKNTLPGDTATAQARGVRLGTPWVTQRGMGPEEMDQIAGCIQRLVTAVEPFSYPGLSGPLPRGKINLDALESVKRDVAELAGRWSPTAAPLQSDYPHHTLMPVRSEPQPGRRVLFVCGWRATAFVGQVGTARCAGLRPGKHCRSLLLDRDGQVLDDVFVERLAPDARQRDRYLLAVHHAQAERVKAWLRGLSDGYLVFDPDDLFAKIEGPVVVVDLATDAPGSGAPELAAAADRLLSAIQADDRPLPGADGSAPALYRAGADALFACNKTYFVGQKSLHGLMPAGRQREWQWQPQEGPLKRTCLNQEHRRLTRHLVPFAGWEMPVWYTSVSDEHRATRAGAALYDVSHMGVLGVSGPNATAFLDALTANYAAWLDDGQSAYSHLLDPAGHVIDDLIIYRRRSDDYLVVVNAANADKDWDWLNAANRGDAILDLDLPCKSIEAPAVLKNLKDPACGPEQKVDVALQGPASRDILLRLTGDERTRAGLQLLPRSALMDASIAGMDVVLSRTGYTGEEVGYEIFVHPDAASGLWNTLLEAGYDLGVKPAGLGARDSTRTEAGLPLYGHELGGPYDISPAEAGFASYVKLHKPFFVGRAAYIQKMRTSTMAVIRFRLDEKGVPPLKLGDPVVNRRGRVIGWVTSCAAGLDGYLMGMAFVEKRQAEVGAHIGLFSTGHKGQAAPPELRLGDEVRLHQWATVLPRFARREG